MNLTVKTAEELSPVTERNLARLVEGTAHMRQWIVVGERDSPAFKMQAWHFLLVSMSRLKSNFYLNLEEILLK